jgi:hypothetical protein
VTDIGTPYGLTPAASQTAPAPESMTPVEGGAVTIDIEPEENN